MQEQPFQAWGQVQRAVCLQALPHALPAPPFQLHTLRQRSMELTEEGPVRFLHSSSMVPYSSLAASSTCAVGHIPHACCCWAPQQEQDGPRRRLASWCVLYLLLQGSIADGPLSAPPMVAEIPAPLLWPIP